MMEIFLKQTQDEQHKKEQNRKVKAKQSKPPRIVQSYTGAFVQHKELEHTITLPPEHLGPSLPALLQQTLLAQVEGHCTGRHGYIIAVLGHERLGRGLVQDGSGTGSVEFRIKYRAVVLKPFKNEVVDGVVVTVNKMGFFAEVGPLNIFISNHLIPTDFKFEPNSMPPCYMSEDQGLRIAPGDLVRIKIVGTRVDAAEIFAIGTIKEDYLGLIG